MKILIVLCSFLFSTIAMSNITGLWTGKGTLKTSRSKLPCDIYINVEQTENMFSIISGGYICDYYNVEYPHSEFLIVGNDIFYNGKYSGHIDESKVSIESEFEPGNWFYLTLEKNSQNELLYAESWEVPGSELYVTSNGLALEKQ